MAQHHFNRFFCLLLFLLLPHICKLKSWYRPCMVAGTMKKAVCIVLALCAIFAAVEATRWPPSDDFDDEPTMAEIEKYYKKHQ